MDTKKTLEVIQKLADTGSISEVCHKQKHNTPMPSEDTLKEMVNLIRSIIFPGYFGDAAVNADSRLYHIGVNIDKLQSLLQSQIKAGLCFESTSEERVYDEIDRLAKRSPSLLFLSYRKSGINYILMSWLPTMAIRLPKAMVKLFFAIRAFVPSAVTASLTLC